MSELTDRQALLADQVLKHAGITGSNCRDLLRATDADLGDKVAVADYLGGPGAGSEFLLDDTRDLADERDDVDGA